MAPSVAIRLGLEGGDVIKRGLDEVAKSGQAAFDGMAGGAERASKAAERAEERYKRMAQAAREAQAADQSQAGVNRLLGVTEAPNQSASRDRLRDLEAAFAPIPKAVSAVAVANDNVTKSIGLQRHEWINLSRQMQDVGTMALMGSSPIMILASQGAQVYDVLATSGGGVKGALKEVGSTIAGLVSPGRAAFAAIAAGAGLAYVSVSRITNEANEVNKALRIGAGLRSGMTAGDIEALSRGVAGMSRSEARSSALAYAGTGATRANTTAAQGLTFGLAGAMYDGDISAAQKGLGDAMRGGTSSLIRYVDTIRPLSTATTDWIERLAATQGEQAANTELLRLLNDGIKAAGLEVPIWRQALTRLGNIASDLADDFLKEGGKRVGTTGQEFRLLTEGRGPLGGNTVRELSAIGSFLSGLVPEWGTPREDPRQRPPVDEQRYGRPLTPITGSGLNIPLPPAGLDAVESSIADLQAQMARGAAGTGTVRRLNGTYGSDAEALRKLNDDLANYDRLLNDTTVTSQMSTKELEASRTARERLAGAIDSHLTGEEKRRKSDELTMRSIFARTDAERAAIAVEQKRLDLSGERVRAEERLRQAEEARLDILRRSTKEAEDRLRASNDNLGLAGRLPYDRARAEIEQRYRRQNEENAENPEALRRNAAARVNDLRALDVEQFQVPLRSATMSINEQIGALNVMRDSLFATDEQAATFAARQELVNAAIRSGVPVTQAYGGQIEQLAAQMGKVAAANQEFQRVRGNIVGGMDEIRQGFSGALSGITADIAGNKGRNVGQILVGSLSRLSDQMLERTVFRPLTEGIFGRMGQPGGGLIGSLISGSGVFGTMPNAPSPLSLPAITAPMATVNATSVVVNGGGLGSLGLGANPATGSPLGGAGSGGLGFGLGGPQSAGTQAIGSGLGSFGFGANGLRTAGLSSDMARYAKAIQSLESGGNYSILGPITKSGDRAYGAYQMMGNNIPEWTRQTFGRSMSPKELLGDKAAQDAVFAKIFGGYVERFGPSGAAQAWFGGPGSVGKLGRRDILGTSVGEYGAKFDRALSRQSGQSGSFDFDAAAKSFQTSSDQASQSLSSLAGATAQLPAGVDAATASLANLFSSLFSGKGGSGGLLSGLFGGGSGGGASGFSTGAETWFANGGYTGPGGMYEPRGIVHAGEVVWSQHDVARAGGPHVVDAMRRGVRGYAEGGIVPPSPIPARRASMPRAQAGGGTTVQVSSNIHNYAGAQVEQRETRGPNGQIQLDTFVRAAERRMASKASRNRGEAKDVFLTNQAAMNRG